jgi:hypothetical protein
MKIILCSLLCLCLYSVWIYKYQKKVVPEEEPSVVTYKKEKTLLGKTKWVKHTTPYETVFFKEKDTTVNKVGSSNVLTLTNSISLNEKNYASATIQAFSKDQVVYVYGEEKLEVNLGKGYAIYDRDGKMICDNLPDFLVFRVKDE